MLQLPREVQTAQRTDLLPHIAACKAVLATIKPGICVKPWDAEAVAHAIKPILQPQTASLKTALTGAGSVQVVDQIL